ncbi:MAG: mammalian cell entry protein [Nitrosomonadaceae bacterium]|nr:mammalian cell entry protein [Nitrosomonadaceae bacterium]|tara:strand:+ start:3745 stop:4659 length:915 start_codon:yes stop_codon:yes gene_type:complete
MENRSHALIAGLFVIFLITALAITTKWLSGETDDHVNYILVSDGSVSGLNPQAAVRFRGVKVGKVQNIDFDPKNSRFIRIRIGVDRNIPLTKGVFAQLGYQGVTGLAYIQLDDNGDQPELLKPSEVNLPIIPMRTSTLDNIVITGQDLLNSVNETVKKMNDLLNDKNRENFSHLLKNMENATNDFSNFTQQLQPNLKSFPELTSKTNILLSNADQLVKNINQVIDKIGQQGGVIDNLSKSAEEISDTIPRIQEAIDGVKNGTRNVDRILLQLEEQPRSLIFGKTPLPPGPGEAGFISPQGTLNE